MIREILALGLNDKERIGVKTALCFGLTTQKDNLNSDITARSSCFLRQP